MHANPVLPIGRYRALFSSAAPVRFTDFPGNAWRGALGHALKAAVCVTRAPECRNCLLYRSCVFSYFWDTPPHVGAEKMRKYQTAPHPFVLAPDDADPSRLGFTLIGQANRHLPVFVHALGRAAGGPRGVSGNVLALQRIEQMVSPEASAWQTIFSADQPLQGLPLRPAVVPPVPARCTLVLETPLRVKRDGAHVGPEQFRFADLFGNLLRRVSMLRYFHSEQALEVDFQELMAAARELDADCQLRWREQTRYSTRQHAALQMGGVVGRISIDGTNLTPFWPYLWIGQWLHAGTGATMGLGRYRIEDRSGASLPAAGSGE